MTNNQLEILSQCYLFNGMSAEQISFLLERTEHKIIRLSSKEVFFYSGDNLEYLYIILSGSLTTRMMSESGRTLQVGQLKPAMIVAPAFIFVNNGIPVSVEADTRTTLLRISADNMRKLINEDETIRWNYINIISRKCAFLTDKLHFISLLSIKEKVMQILKYEQTQQGSNTIVIDASRQRLAESFGIQKNSLQRCLTELADEGKIVLNGKQITILK